MTELSFGQKIDDNGLVMPWFTHGALDFIKKIDLSDKIIWMWGAGMGDCWLAKRCKELHIVERVSEWIYKSQDMLSANGVTNVKYYHRPCNEGSGEQDMYCEVPEDVLPDVFIVDDAYRYECILKSISFLKQSGKSVLLIVDNWQQDFIFICPSAEEVLKDYYKLVFPCPEHKDHEGNGWQTAIFNLWGIKK